MATQYWMDEGELDVISKYLQSYDLYIGLFSNPGTITEDMVLGDLTELTVEVGGYTRQLIDKDDWTLVGSIASQPFKTFDFASDNTVKGYFITDTSSGAGKVIAVVLFDTPYSMLTGEFLKIKANIEVK